MMVFFTILVVLCFTLTNGADPFETLFFRLNCYDHEQPGCNKTFVEAYPELAWSVTNLTIADTYMYMFTRKNAVVPELMHKCAGELPPNTTFDPKCRTEIVLPGYVSGICNYAIFRQIKDERLKSGCYNVLLIDWMWGNSLDLEIAMLNVKIVADQLVIVIDKLKEKYGLTADDFILTGHSFGAHMAGIIGNNTKIGIINGVEPAGITYTESTPLTLRLDPGDAECVQVLHSNAGECLPNYFGVNFTCGTFDVFFNGGLHQIDQCRPTQEQSFLIGDYVYAFFSILPAACSHFQALQYYKDSINPTDCQQTGVACPNVDVFNGGQCNSCGESSSECLSVGAYACDCYNKKTHTNYFLNTTKLCPFCNEDNKFQADRCGSKKPPSPVTFCYKC